MANSTIFNKELLDNTSIDTKIINHINELSDLKIFIENNNNKNNTKKKQKEKHITNELIKENLLMANEIIPEMSVLSDLIYLNGKICGYPLKIMVDTGAQSCAIFKSVIDKCGIDYLVDRSSSMMIMSALGSELTFGTLWYLEIEIELRKKKYISIPITTEIINDYEIIKSNIKHDFDIILGMTFLKSYRANIDFFTKIITLNNDIKIKFK